MAMSLDITEVRHSGRSSHHRPHQTRCESSVEREVAPALHDPVFEDPGRASLFMDLITNMENKSYVVIHHAVEHHE
jgi:hypothetical protein